MAYFVVSSWLGEPCNAAPEEHDALAWVTEIELDGLVMADPMTVAIIRRALRWPGIDG